MKKIVLFAMCCILYAQAFAQKKVDTSAIISQALYELRNRPSGLSEYQAIELILSPGKIDTIQHDFASVPVYLHYGRWVQGQEIITHNGNSAARSIFLVLMMIGLPVWIARFWVKKRRSAQTA